MILSESNKKIIAKNSPQINFRAQAACLDVNPGPTPSFCPICRKCPFCESRRSGQRHLGMAHRWADFLLARDRAYAVFGSMR
jgi:hypothetical protein